MIVLQTKVWYIDGAPDLSDWIDTKSLDTIQSQTSQLDVLLSDQISLLVPTNVKTKCSWWFSDTFRGSFPCSETSLVIPHIHLGQGKIHYSSLPGTISGKYSPSSLLLVTHNGQHAFRKLIKDVKDITFLFSKIRCWLLSGPPWSPAVNCLSYKPDKLELPSQLHTPRQVTEWKKTFSRILS